MGEMGYGGRVRFSLYNRIGMSDAELDSKSSRTITQTAQPEPWMKRYFKPLVVLAALMVALTLTIYRSGPQGLASLQVGTERSSRAAAVAEAQKPYDLASLRVLNMTLQRIRDKI